MQRLACASVVTLRSAYVDRRVHCNTLKVLAEWPRVGAQSALLTYNGQVMVANVQPVFIEKWLNDEFEGRFTHTMSFLTVELPCLAPVVPVQFGNYTVPIRGVITNSKPPKPRIESCVAVVRSFNDYVGEWLDNQKELGVSRVNMYVANAGLGAKHALINEKSREDWINMVPWASASQSAAELDWWSKTKGEVIRVGHGDVFYYSQTLALVDCIYNAAARGVSHVIAVDMDELVVTNRTSLLAFKQHAPINTVNYFFKKRQAWTRWNRSPVDRHVKTLMIAADILDAFAHGPAECVRSPCLCVAGRCAINSGAASSSLSWAPGLHIAHLQPAMPTRLLVMVLSCIKYRGLWAKKLSVWEDTVVVTADPQLDDEFKAVGRILWVRCQDSYDALPVKVAMAFRAIVKMEAFASVTHILKTDDHDNSYSNSDLMRIKALPALKKHRYVGGQINAPVGNSRVYHFNKVPKQSFWDNREYTGDYVPWADGGCGYVIRRDALECFALFVNVTALPETEIYEDLMVAKVLAKCGIKPYRAKSKWIKGDK
ncbi:MAG: glycosyltransferase family 92 protein [Limisphaerales bacterium]